MSENELPPLPDDLASLLDAEKTRPDPAANVQDRLFSRLESSIATLPPDGGGGGGGGGGEGGGHGGETAGSAVAGAGGAGAASLATKATLGGALLAKPLALATATFALGSVLGAAVDHAAIQPEPQRTKIVYVDRIVPMPKTSARAPAPDESVAMAPSSTPKIAARATPAPSGAPSIAASNGVPSGGHDAQLAGERALIEIARTALGKNDTAAALDALGKHDAKYPHGQLTEEREALAVQALAGAGRMDEARTRGARFKRDFPGSMLTPVVDSALR